MNTYYIYHIKGVKWGCTNNLKRRLKTQGYELSDACEVIEQTDLDTAAELEMQLNLRDGYGWNKTEDYKRMVKVGKMGGEALYKKYSAAEIKQIRIKGGIKKRILTQEQLEFIKNNYAPSTNQHDRLPNKMSMRGIAKVLNVSYDVIQHAIKHYF